VTTDVSNLKGLDRIKGLQVNTHEFGHAIDTNIATKFGFYNNFRRTAASEIGRPEFIAKLLYDLERSKQNYTPKYNQRDLADIVRNKAAMPDAMKFDLFDLLTEQGATSDQIEILQHSISFNEGILEYQLVAEGGRAEKEEVAGFIQEKDKDKVLKLFRDETKAIEDLQEKAYEQTGYNQAYKDYKEVFDKLDEQFIENQRLEKLVNQYEYFISDSDFRRDIAASNGWDKNFASRAEYEKAKIKIQNAPDEEKKLREKYNFDAIKARKEQTFEQANMLIKPEKDKYNIKKAAMSQVSDFYDALTGGRFYENSNIQIDGLRKSGHGQNYYSDHTMRDAEIFTHLCTLNMHYPQAYQALKRDYPKIFNAHERMMELSFQAFEDTKGQKDRYSMPNITIRINPDGVVKR
jgi:hypothetical protein